MRKKATQLTKVRNYLLSKAGKAHGLSSLYAFREWNITRLSAIIHTLRHREGYNISSGFKQYKKKDGTKTCFACYKITD